MSLSADEEEDVDLMESVEDLSQPEFSDFESWTQNGGQKRLQAEIDTIKRFGYDGGFACRHWANEIVVLLEMPFDRLGLSTERAHSLRLEPGCCLLLKTTARLLSHHLPPDGASLLQCAVHSFSSNRRKLVLPELKFSVVKSKPGELGKFVAEAARSEASAVEYNQEFALRWSLEHLLNSLLASTLAAESSEHLPERIAKGTSLPYVRELHQHLSIDSEEYCKQESLDTLRKKALEAAVAEAASQPKMEWPDCAEEQREVDGNLWLRLLHFLREQVLVGTQCCLVCHRPMEVVGVKPSVCSQALCVHQWEEMNLGANIELEVEHNPEVVDLLVSLAYHHFAKSCTLGDSAPSWKTIRAFWWGTGRLQGSPESCRLEGQDVDFMGQLEVGDSIRIMCSPVVGMQAQVRVIISVAGNVLEVDEPFTFEVDGFPFEIMWKEEREHQWDIGYEFANLIDKLPSIKMMQSWVAGGHKIQEKLDEKDGRLVCVLRWILCSFRGHLRYLDGAKKEELIPELQGFKQFVMMCSTPHHESKFLQHAKDSPVKNAFHGSPIPNWHNILRQGLNFSKTSHGRSYGDGIYLALDAATSLGYTHSNRAAGAHQGSDRSGSSHFHGPLERSQRHHPNCFEEGCTWIGGKSMFDDSLACLAVVDVIYRPEKFVSTVPHWVVKDTDYVVTRFLCVKDKSTGASPALANLHARGPSIPASKLTMPAPSTSRAAPAARSARSSTGHADAGGKQEGGGEEDLISAMSVMFPNIDVATVRSVLVGVGFEESEAVLTLSSMAEQAQAAGGGGSGGGGGGRASSSSRPNPPAQTSGGPAKRRRSSAEGWSESQASPTARARSKAKVALPSSAGGGKDVIDLTADSDEDNPPTVADPRVVAAAGQAATVVGGCLSEAEAAPPESAIQEVLAVLTHLSRKEAVELLRRNHCNPEDAVNSLFAQDK